MKERMEQWLAALPALPGILACGVRLPNGHTLSRTCADEFNLSGLETAWQCLTDLFDVFELNALPSQSLRWIFANAVLHGERRADGVCLGVFTTRDPWGRDVAGLQQLVISFHQSVPAADPAP